MMELTQSLYLVHAIAPNEMKLRSQSYSVLTSTPKSATRNRFARKG